MESNQPVVGEEFDPIVTSVAEFMFNAFDPSGYDWSDAPAEYKLHYLHGAEVGVIIACGSSKPTAREEPNGKEA